MAGIHVGRDESSEHVWVTCAARNGDNRLEIFVLDDIGSLQHMWQKGVNRAGGWEAGHLGGATLGGLGVKLAELGTRMAWIFRE
jgi:hypothetical protein